MKKIMVFDTAVASLNMGDEIIKYSIQKNWPELYSNNYIITMPTHTPTFHLWQHILARGIRKYNDVDYSFICGTNLLYTDMIRPYPLWNIYLHNTMIQRNVICLGTGIGANSKKVNAYTRALYKKVLSKEFTHSVRDEKAKALLESIGLKAVNTGCPTLWGLTEDFCKKIPKRKTQKAIFTLTEYHSDFESDKFMIDTILNNYQKVYFWPQSIKDLEYLQSIYPLERFTIINPNLISYENILLNEDIDYIGNRLHGGIFSLQHKHRTIIIGIDYRAMEMHKTFSIPYILRENISELDNMINSEWGTHISGINYDAISAWKAQFKF